MGRGTSYPPELRERAVRMVAEVRRDHPSDWPAIRAWSVTPVDGELTYAEGTFIGYRGHYSGRAPAPAFWFGHGLRYSTWDYPAAEFLRGDGSPGARVQVINTGDRRSREIVQL